MNTNIKLKDDKLEKEQRDDDWYKITSLLPEHFYYPIPDEEEYYIPISENSHRQPFREEAAQ